MKNLTTPRVAVIVPCYKRPEYTRKCIEALRNSQEYDNVKFYLFDDGSEDGTLAILDEWKSDDVQVVLNHENIGLRNTIIRFFEMIKDEKFDYIAKMDNDCAVPKNWLNDILKVFSATDLDVVSPNVMPSNAALTYGKFVDGLSYMPTEVVGGLWAMKASLIKNMYFEKHPTNGLIGAISILKQICTENEVKIGWLPNIIVDDIGHWSGEHKDHIKSVEHEIYSKKVGRNIAWSST